LTANARTISGHKIWSVFDFDRYSMVDEKDLKNATALLEKHSTSAAVRISGTDDPFESDPEDLKKNESSEGIGVTY
jgi:hypothetical protein